MTDGFSKGVSAIGSTGAKAFSGFAKVSVAAIGAASTGVSAIGACAVKSYAEYEQLVGGVDTLFKESSQTVQQYADQAYMTAGLSANAYMETVTGFSASLLQSLDGDTEKAAQAANQAVIDMSDNANKMGTDMESIQNAYQGFAKQNYTMLDNLKLGYGGTKEEMQRLLDDASKLSGIKYDISSFSDITEAIHVVQTEMGITGTTAQEANETIEGSVNAMKGAWENLVAGMANDNADFELLIDNFIDSAVIVGENIIPRVEIILQSIGELIERLLPVIVERVPAIISDFLPGIIESGMGIVSALGQGIIDNLPAIVEFAVQLLLQLTEALEQNSPQIMDAAAEIIKALVNAIIQLAPALLNVAFTLVEELGKGIANNLPEIQKRGTELFTEFCNAIRDKLPELVTSGFEMIANLANGIVSNIPSIISQAGNMLIQFLDAILDALPSLLSAGADMILNILSGIVKNLPSIIKSILTLMINIIATIGKHLPDILKKGIEIIGKLLAGIIKQVPELLKAIPGIIEDVGKAFLEKDWLKIGADIISSIAQGIVNGVGSIVDAAKQAASSALDAAKKALGVESSASKGEQTSSNTSSGSSKGGQGAFGIALDSSKRAQAALDSGRLPEKFRELGEKCLAGFNEPLEDYDPYDALQSSIQTSAGANRRAFAGYYAGGSCGSGRADYKQMKQVFKEALQELNLTVQVDSRTIGRVVRGFS